MGNISKVLEEVIKFLQPEILELYNNCYDYIMDLFSYKNLKITIKLSDLSHQELEKKINILISVTNSALNTIGVSPNQLTSETIMFKDVFLKNKNQYSDLESFFELGLKQYINFHLFKVILEYLTGIDKNKIENLNLFDLLPKNFINKLNQFRKENVELLKEKDYYNCYIDNLEEYYDATTFFIDQEKLQLFEKKIQEESKVEILEELEKAKKENIEVLKDTFSSAEISHNDLQLIDKEVGFVKKLNLFDYFGNVPQLEKEKREEIKINIKNITDGLNILLEFLDLENLYYYITILKILDINNPFSNENIVDMLKKFINGKVFSTGMYHKPNPVSNFYGLSILSEFDLLDKTELIDIFDIEMFLENELNNFLPEKLALNFYTLLSLKIIENKGEKISNKDHLIKPLVDLDLLHLEEKSLPVDLFYHIGMMILIDRDINLNIFKNVYNTEIKKLVSPMGLINNNLTDTARALLVYDLLDLQNEEFATINTLYNNIIRNSSFFSENEIDKEFNWKNNNVAFKVELRMLFWTLLASLRLKI